MPSQLLERRPDIAAEERRMAAANEQIGIAKAAYYPTVSLGALAGFQGGSSVGPAPCGPSGRPCRKPFSTADAAARHRISRSTNYDAAVANYRQTALTAFQQVEDNLAALRVLETESQQQKEATASAATVARSVSNAI